MFKRLNTKMLIIIISAMICISTVGVCYAFLTKSSEEVLNSFTLGSISCEIDETFDGDIKKDVFVSNTSDVSVLVRSNIIVTWMSKDGKIVYSEVPELGKDYTMTINEEDWFVGSDGYYYYNDIVDSMANTSVLIEEAKMIEGVTPPDGFYLSVEIISSAIQSNPNSAVKDAWKVVEYNGTNLVSIN